MASDVVLTIDDVCFKVNFTRLSPFIQSFPVEDGGSDGVPVLRLSGGGIATSDDLAALLEILELVYESSQTLGQASFIQTARVLRAATQFQFVDLREAALIRLKELYPPRPEPFAEWRYVHEATQLAIDCRVREVLPTLLYTIVTTSDFDIEDAEHTDEPPAAAPNIVQVSLAPTVRESTKDKVLDQETRGSTLSASTTRVCVKLMKRIMDHFTPILFTVPTGSHMECTGVFADHWMEYAIQPAIEHSGVYKPLETLQRIQAVDWRRLGLCVICCAEKEQDWKREADIICGRIEGWADLDGFWG